MWSEAVSMLTWCVISKQLHPTAELVFLATLFPPIDMQFVICGMLSYLKTLDKKQITIICETTVDTEREIRSLLIPTNNLLRHFSHCLLADCVCFLRACSMANSYNRCMICGSWNLATTDDRCVKDFFGYSGRCIQSLTYCLFCHRPGSILFRILVLNSTNAYIRSVLLSRSRADIED